ncbi:MAG: chloramphenicol resistance protein [Clostridia bacterium]|nr:chloramphenicol resistance protein [Clostridia bacterium]
MIKELHEFFKTCPLLDASKINIDYLGSKSGGFTIEALPCEPVMRRYYTGGSLRQYCFVLALRRPYTGSVAENLKNEQLCEQLAEWVEECSQSGNLPKLPKGESAQELAVTSGGYLFDEATNHARYQIGFRLIYTKI